MVLACALALGMHWAVLQTVAWTGMFLGRLPGEAVGVALSRTFDGEHRCRLCEIVRDGRLSERASDDRVAPWPRLEGVWEGGPGEVVRWAEGERVVFAAVGIPPVRHWLPPLPPPRRGGNLVG